MPGVTRRLRVRGDGAAAARVPSPLPRRVHRPMAAQALDVPSLPVRDRPHGGDGRQPATTCLAHRSYSLGDS